MRYIPPDLLERIQKLNQSIYENADPKMEATLELLQQQLSIQILYSLGVEAGKIDFCARREDPDGPITDMYFIAISAGRAYVYRSIVISQEFGVLLMPFFQWGLASDVSCEFDGEWKVNSAGDKVFVTKSEPFFFAQHQGIIYSKHGAGGLTQQVTSGIGAEAKIVALRGWEDTQQFAGAFDVDFTVSRIDTSLVEQAGVSIRKAQYVEFTAENDENILQENVVITIQQTVGNQGLILFYTRNNQPKAIYKPDWVADWSEERDIDLPGDLADVNLFRGIEPGRIGYVGEKGNLIEMAVTEPYHHAPEEPLHVGPGRSASIIQRPDGTLNMYYLQSDKRIAKVEAVHNDWESIEVTNMDIQHTGSDIRHLRAKDLYDDNLFVVWLEGEDYKLGRLLDEQELEEYLIAQGTLQFNISNPIAQATLQIEAVPPKLPQLPKPVWDEDTLTWQKEATPDEQFEWPAQDVEFTVIDNEDNPIEGAEIALIKEW